MMRFHKIISGEDWYFVSKIVLTYCENFEITGTIYSNREKAEQFSKQNDFVTCSWRFLRFNTLEQLGFGNFQEKLEQFDFKEQSMRWGAIYGFSKLQ